MELILEVLGQEIRNVNYAIQRIQHIVGDCGVQGRD